MMLFAAMLKARPGIADMRAQYREAHDAYWDPRMSAIWLAGPLLSEEGDRIGQIMIVEADDRTAAHAMISGDPYVANGGYEPFEATAFRASVREGAET